MTCSAGLRAATKTPTVRFCAFRTHLFCAPPLPLCYVPAAGVITADHDGCVGHAGGPHGCSGAGAAPPALGDGKRKGRGREWGLFAGFGAAASAGPLQCRDCSRGGAGMVLGMTPVCRAAGGGGCDLV